VRGWRAEITRTASIAPVPPPDIGRLSNLVPTADKLKIRAGNAVTRRTDENNRQPQTISGEHPGECLPEEEADFVIYAGSPLRT